MNLIVLSKIKSFFKKETHEIKIIVNNKVVKHMRLNKYSLLISIFIFLVMIFCMYHGALNDNIKNQDPTVNQIRNLLNTRSMVLKNQNTGS